VKRLKVKVRRKYNRRIGDNFEADLKRLSWQLGGRGVAASAKETITVIITK
jgi:hypothetical protein